MFFRSGEEGENCSVCGAVIVGLSLMGYLLVYGVKF